MKDNGSQRPGRDVATSAPGVKSQDHPRDRVPLQRSIALCSDTAQKARARVLTQAIALEEQGPAGILRGAVFLMLFFLVGAIAWSAVTVVHETARAPGAIMPANYSINIQHVEGGVVKALHVRDGDRVAEGELLLELDDTLLRSELEQVRIRHISYEMQAERLAALLENRQPDFKVSSPVYRHLADKQRTIFLAQHKSHRRKIQVLESQVRQRERALERQRNLVGSLEQEVRLYKELVDMKRELFDENLASRNELIKAQAALVESRSRLEQARDDVLVASSALDEAYQRKLELEAAFYRDIELEAGEVARELAEVNQLLIGLQDKLERLELRAPTEGTIQNLKINNEQAVVQPGQLIMQIVPSGDELVVHARVSPADIGHVRVGSHADVRVDSYDPVRFGMLAGEVRQISASTYLDENNQPYYRAEIILPHSHLGGEDRYLRIIPGMTVTADIRTGEKTLLDYLLRPIRRGLDTAFSER